MTKTMTPKNIVSITYVMLHVLLVILSLVLPGYSAVGQHYQQLDTPVADFHEHMEHSL